MKTRKQQKQQTNRNRAIWLVCRTDTNMHGFWLDKPTFGWKIFVPENRSIPYKALFFFAPILHRPPLSRKRRRYKKSFFMIRRKVLFRSMIRFLFQTDKRTLETLPNSKYCSYSKDFFHNNWQNLLRASQKLKSQDVTSCYLSKHEVQCREHTIVYMSGTAERILYWGG